MSLIKTTSCYRWCFLAVFSICCLVACDKDENKKNSSQIAVKVNGAEISMHQMNQVMRGLKNVTPENADSARKQVLEKLIDQQLVVEKATKENMDRTPDVLLAIEAAKKDILARAYINKLVSSSIKVSDEEVKKYFDEHPPLFSNRRIYALQDIGMLRDAQLSGELKSELDKGRTMQEVAEFLKTKGVKFSGNSYTKPAEQLPLDLLPKLQQLKDGQTALVEVGNSMHLIHLVKSQEAPIDIKTATPFIRSYYVNTRGKKLVEDEMKKLRQQAKIEYVGDFAKTATATENKGESPAVKQDDTKSNTNPELEKGISGLK